ncbi:archaemetzincin-2 [Patella vulgata]|uniref:archaemetzincin-2 n=1 Tax=Patella vulgata TaxID=6465 RepID=UPI00218049EB|nr:archaemetzincin-2 [Patella vulgata]
MGATSSNPTEQISATGDQSSTSNVQYLLGDIQKLAPSARKLFNLGKECLTTSVARLPFGNEPELKFQEATNLADLQNPDFRLFRPLKLTQPLYSGQTYVKWRSVRDVQNVYAFCAPVKTIIYIQPIDEFPEFIKIFRLTTKRLELTLFSLLQSFCQIYFSGFDSHVLPEVNIKDKQWQIRSRHHSVTEQKQYYVGDFFPYLQRLIPSNGLCILGLTWTDLYPQDDLNFVLGESSAVHKSAMFCFGRYEPKGFDKETHQDIKEVDGLLIWKLLRIISHETCHLLGFQHCTFFHCAMNESNSIEEAVTQPLFLCPVCLRKLQKCCGFNVLERYKAMAGFLQELQDQLPCEQLQSAVNWLQKCLQYLEEG